MESSYLKSTVGPVLAKGIAETVVAQPSNPQEYLALYLLHHIQQEERKKHEQAKKVKAENIRNKLSQVEEQKQKAAVDLIQRKFRSFRSQIQEKKQREEEYWSLYEESVGEAEELLDNLPDLQGNGRDSNDNKNEENLPPGEPSLEERTERLNEARRTFFSEQRFIYNCINKTLLGEMKSNLKSKREVILRGIAESEKIKELEIQKEDDALDVDYDPLHREPNLPAAAQDLLRDLLLGENKTRSGQEPLKINVSLVNYRVLRSLCYLLFNATPKATDAPEKVFQLLKPTQLAPLLKAFNPVGSYYRNLPLKLEKEIMKYNKDFVPEQEDGTNAQKEEEEPEGEPIPQPQTRQIRRVMRLMRFLFSNKEYYCDLLPSDFVDEEALEAEDQEENESSNSLRAQEEEAAATKEFLAQLKERILNDLREKGFTVLYALVKYVDAAVRYRTLRDEWVEAIRSGNDPSSANYEIPDEFEAAEDEGEDENNEEVLIDDDGNPDFQQIQLLLNKIGEDCEERIVKIWEKRDERRKKKLTEYAVAFQKARETNDEDDEEES